MVHFHPHQHLQQSGNIPALNRCFAKLKREIIVYSNTKPIFIRFFTTGSACLDLRPDYMQATKPQEGELLYYDLSKLRAIFLEQLAYGNLQYCSWEKMQTYKEALLFYLKHTNAYSPITKPITQQLSRFAKFYGVHMCIQQKYHSIHGDYTNRAIANTDNLNDQLNYIQYINKKFQSYRKTREFWKILDLDVDASIQEVNTKTKELLLKWHPDKNSKDCQDKQIYTVICQNIIWAKESFRLNLHLLPHQAMLDAKAQNIASKLLQQTSEELSIQEELREFKIKNQLLSNRTKRQTSLMQNANGCKVTLDEKLYAKKEKLHQASMQQFYLQQDNKLLEQQLQCLLRGKSTKLARP